MTSDSAAVSAAIDEHLQRVRSDWTNVGLAVAVVRQGDVIYSRGFGTRQYGRSAPIDEHTLFQIGSTTKAFTAAALGTLVDENRLSWDDPVTLHLSDFQLRDPWLTQNLTVRDVLAHRSGVVGSFYPSLALMKQDAVVFQARHLEPEARFRDSYRYSNLMYAVAGKLLEATSGSSWGEFIRNRILAPLRMTHSGVSPYEFWANSHIAPTFLGSAPSGTPSCTDSYNSNVAMPHVYGENGSLLTLPWQSYDNAAAAGALVSCAADMANWLVVNVNGGRFDGKQLLSRRTLGDLHSTQNLHIDATTLPFEESPETYTMGWRRGLYRGCVHLAHGGGITGFPAYMAVLPDQKSGIVVLSNGPVIGGSAFHKAIAFGVFDHVLGLEPRDWNQEFLHRVRTTQLEAQQAEENRLRSRLPERPPTLSLESYTGTYEDTQVGSGPVLVALEGGELWLRFPGDGAFSCRLEHWHGDIFRIRAIPGVRDVLEMLEQRFVSFGVDPYGQVSSMSVFKASFQRVRREERVVDGTLMSPGRGTK